MTKPLTTREEILRLLDEAGTWRSGEEISALLGISRAAVSKQVRTLRAEGRLIEAAPRRGYRLRRGDGPFHLARLQGELETRVLGQRQWVWLDCTGSTNRDAAALAAQGAPEGTVVLAERQEQGRGRKGRQWFHAPRSLCFSFILRPLSREKPEGPFAPTDLPQELMRQSAEAVAEVLRELGFEARFKAPNDVCIEDRKVCGVLAESGFQAEDLDWVVVGVGLNVNAGREYFPPDLAWRMTSLMEEKGTPLDRTELFARLLLRLEERLVPGG